MHFGEKQINDLYRFPDVDMAAFEAKGCELGSWMVEKLCQGKEVLWTIRAISMNDSISKARM